MSSKHMSARQMKLHILATRTSKKTLIRCGFIGGAGVVGVIFVAYLVVGGVILPVIATVQRFIMNFMDISQTQARVTQGSGATPMMQLFRLLGYAFLVGVAGSVAATARAKAKEIKIGKWDCYTDVYPFIALWVLAGIYLVVTSFGWLSLTFLITSPIQGLIAREIWWRVYSRVLFNKSELGADDTMDAY